MRRPLFLAVVFGCVLSVTATGTVTLRVAGPAAVYWSFVPLVEVLALMALILHRRPRVPLPLAIDAFFAGHGPWILFLVAFSTLLSFMPLSLWWALLTGPALWATAFVMLWSAYIDFCFFRVLLAESRVAAVRDVVVNRVLTWTVVFVVLGVPALTPRGIAKEIAEALQEVLREWMPAG